MRVPAALCLALLLVSLAAAGTARADSRILVGVDDDLIKWTSRPTTVVATARSLHVDAMRVTLQWTRGRSTLSGRDHTQLRRAVTASRYGVQIVLSVYGRATDAPDERSERDDYCDFVEGVLRRYTEIRNVVIWNEVNSPAFWQPGGDPAAAYEALLAQCWDDIHESLPNVRLLTTTAANHDPAEFIRGVGVAYRASGRTRPIFDAAGHNPYPLYPDEPVTATHTGYIGQGDYARLVGALDDAFARTGQQPTAIWYLEDGFQSTIDVGRRSYYSGRESIGRAVSPSGQASQVAAALRLASCQPRVAAFFNFLLVDERSLAGWQSGLLWADWRRKPAFDAYRQAIDDVRRGAVPCGSGLGVSPELTPALSRLLDSTW